MTQIQNTSWSFAEAKYFRVAARENTLAPPGRHRPRHSRMSLTSFQSRPAIDAAIPRPNGTLYQLQPSFHLQSTEPEPTARARRAGKEFYQTTPEFMFVSFRLLMVESVLFTSATVRPIKGSVRAARFDDSGTPRFMCKRPQNLNLRVSATPLSRWTKTPLFYSRSTDLPVLRGRRYVRGALNWPQTGGL